MTRPPGVHLLLWLASLGLEVFVPQIMKAGDKQLELLMDLLFNMRGWGATKPKKIDLITLIDPKKWQHMAG